MFFQLVKRNSRRSRKENGLFFASLLISIIAFYIILSLSHQDVMLFLEIMESDAVDRLLTMIPAFYGISLMILFFLIYFAGKFQMERRRHEFGIYLMMGMRRTHLFAMLLAEQLQSSVFALMTGLPAAVLISELISLMTARLVGIGIIGHRFSFSIQAALWTIAGFLLIHLTAFLILSGRMTRQEIGSLLVETPAGSKKQLPPFVYASALITGLVCLAAAYGMAIKGISWIHLNQMAFTLLLGFAGTMLLFYGLRFPIGLTASRARKDRQLLVFNFRQLQETVIHRSCSMAVSSLLILAALCCFGAGTATAYFYGHSEEHILDYTFTDHRTVTLDTLTDASGKADFSESFLTLTENILTADGLRSRFSHLFEMKTGHIRTTEDYDHAFQMDAVLALLSETKNSDAKRILLSRLDEDYPYLISLSGYNQLLSIAGLPMLKLDSNEASVYMDSSSTAECIQLMNQILSRQPQVFIDSAPFHLTGTVQTSSLVTDRSITLSFALIVPDEAFEYYTQGDYSTYLNGVLNTSEKKTSLMEAINDMNEKLNRTELSYESYLQNMGRQLFYVVAASYITLYLAAIFLIIANTFIGVQFLIGQQKACRRYQTLIRLGATYDLLCQSVNKQISWHFGIPALSAALSSLFGVRALFSGLLPHYTQNSIPEMLLVSAAIIFVLCVIEYIYMTVVKRTGTRYLLTLMEPAREE